MAVQLSEAVRNSILSAVTAAIDGDVEPGYVEIRSGTRPANVGTAATGSVLLTLTLNDPSFAAPAAGSAALTIDPVIEDEAVASGTASWARVYDGSGAAILDCSVGTSSGDFLLSATNILTGATVTLTAGSLTMAP